MACARRRGVSRERARIDGDMSTTYLYNYYETEVLSFPEDQQRIAVCNVIEIFAWKLIDGGENLPAGFDSIFTYLNLIKKTPFVKMQKKDQQQAIKILDNLLGASIGKPQHVVEVIRSLIGLRNDIGENIIYLWGSMCYLAYAANYQEGFGKHNSLGNDMVKNMLRDQLR